MLTTDAGKRAGLVALFRVPGATLSARPGPAAAPAPAAKPAPSAHGGGNWEIEASPAPAPAASSGNAARDLWQDF
ncbi:chemotaxis protein, partial [Leisingera sp. JC11]